jgi:hypothetical protein
VKSNSDAHTTKSVVSICVFSEAFAKEVEKNISKNKINVLLSLKIDPGAG